MTTKTVTGHGCAKMKNQQLARTTAEANARVDAARKVCVKKDGDTQTVNASVVTVKQIFTQVGNQTCVDITAQVTCNDEFTAEPTPSEALQSQIRSR